MSELGILAATGRTPLTDKDGGQDEIAAELDEYFKSGKEDAPEQSELDQILAGIGHAINCLLRLSIAIRNPAPYDQFRSRAGAEIGNYQPWDIRHVRDKFPEADLKTAERLGRAMTQRRMYFKYRQDHSDRLFQGLDPDDVDAGNDGATTVASPIPDHLVDSAGDQTLPSGFMFDDALSDITGTSFAPSRSGQHEDRLLEPPVPKGYSEGPVKCPFCHMIIQVETVGAWK